MKTIRHRSGMPYILCGLVVLLYAMVFGLGSVLGYVGALLLAYLSYAPIARLFPDRYVVVEEFPAAKNPSANALIQECAGHMRALRTAGDIIYDPWLLEKVDIIAIGYRGLLRALSENPALVEPLGPYLRYLLPNTVMLLNVRVKLQDRALDNDKVNTRRRIDEALIAVEQSLEKQVDLLEQKRPLRVEEDIRHLKHMLGQSGVLQPENRENIPEQQPDALIAEQLHMQRRALLQVLRDRMEMLQAASFAGVEEPSAYAASVAASAPALVLPMTPEPEEEPSRQAQADTDFVLYSEPLRISRPDGEMDFSALDTVEELQNVEDAPYIPADFTIDVDEPIQIQPESESVVEGLVVSENAVQEAAAPPVSALPQAGLWFALEGYEDEEDLPLYRVAKPMTWIPPATSPKTYSAAQWEAKGCAPEGTDVPSVMDFSAEPALWERMSTPAMQAQRPITALQKAMQQAMEAVQNGLSEGQTDHLSAQDYFTELGKQFLVAMEQGQPGTLSGAAFQPASTKAQVGRMTSRQIDETLLGELLRSPEPPDFGWQDMGLDGIGKKRKPRMEINKNVWMALLGHEGNERAYLQ